MDDFFFDAKFESLIALADIIKVDFLLSGPEERRDLFGLIRNKSVEFLAEKVETVAEFDEAVELGYTYFQGYFFSKPEVLSCKEVPAFKFAYLQLIQAVRGSDVDFSEIERIVKGDVALTYKLLRYINTTGMGLVKYVESIRHSLTLLGQENLRRLFSLVILSTLAEDNPKELMLISLIWVSACESLGCAMGMERRKFDFFLMGMFSAIDAVLGLPMEEALTHVPLTDDAKAALLGDTVVPCKSHWRRSWPTKEDTG